MLNRPYPFALLLLLVSFGAVAADDQRVEAREYKLPLSEEKFKTKDIDAKVASFWAELKPVVARFASFKKGKDHDPLERKERSVRFRDTRECDLSRNSFVFRERQSVKGDDPTVME